MTELLRIIEELKSIHDGEAWHGPSLKEIVAEIRAEQAGAHPIPKAHSIWELVLHLAAWEHTFCQRLAGHPMEVPEEGDFPTVNDTSETAWQQTQAAFDRTHERFIQLLSTLSEADLDKVVAGKEYTVRYLLHGAVRHHVYHAGQIALLKKFVK